MMKTTKLRWIAVGSLLVGLFGGAAGAQIAEIVKHNRSVETGIFALRADDRASFYVTLSDNAPAAAWVRLQFFDDAGTSTSPQDVFLQPGQSTWMTTTGPRRLRARAELRDDFLTVTSQPTLLGTVEVLNLTTAQKAPVCTLVDGGGDGQRQ